MKLPLLTMLLLCHAAFAQWSPVKTFDATSPIQSITDFDFLNELILMKKVVKN